ncbi:amidase domain-containing protein [Sporosarcina aquimarina]|uniref:Amidase domain-containing protein n=1 Tax=Sporosarcina aquimarina TaxID=114975 RepID=A0ABU4FV21_9BACL|nr:amidase domain-containing protein [Sporosarcina aquimarina]MDW0108558.1 amidase domain-containing protein [Sporosarcina aquimarina]
MYDREAAVWYANKWWDGRNPQYPSFDVDCTNYISQCLRAGGAPMHGGPARDRGWWITDSNWSFSWSVAHSLRWYLAGSTRGLTAVQVGSAEELGLGDVIAYDFQGDGRFDHTTIVTAKDGASPLVNAHTYDALKRSWDYKDSYAYRPEAKYVFFRINDHFS